VAAFASASTLAALALLTMPGPVRIGAPLPTVFRLFTNRYPNTTGR
jgi:hypothetical protein